MDCKQARALIIESLYDELSSESAPQLQEHLDHCGDCLKYKAEMQATVEYLDRAVDKDVPVDLAALHEAIDRRRHRLLKFLRRRWPVWVTVGACALMLCMFALFVSEIQYKDGALTISFNGQKTDSLEERTSRILAAYREDQLQFQAQLTDELRSSVTAISQAINEYESQRDEQIAAAFQQMQVRQYQMLAAIREDLENLALQTDDRFKVSYLTTMAAMADLANSQ